MSQLHHDLRSYLTGFGRGDSDGLDRLASFDGWQRVAAAELERRATLVIQSLDDETLKAVAAGELDFQAVCREVLQQLASKAA